MNQSATSLILIATAAFLLPLVARRLRVPAVALELLFGIAIGPTLGIVKEDVFLDQLAELGFFLLMFLSGFEIDLSTFRRQGLGAMTRPLIIFGLTLLTSFAAARMLGYGLFMMFVLATTSVGLVVPTLRSTRRIASPFGQIILVSALLADFLTLVGVTILAVVEKEGAGPGLLAIPGFFIAVAIGLLALRRTAWWYPEKFAHLFALDDPEELGIRAALALMLVFVGVSIVFGIEPVLGAFLAGTMFALVFRQRGNLERQLSGFSFGFLIPVFFINVGLRFDLGALSEPGAWGTTLALLGLSLAAKLIPSLLMLLRRTSLRQTLAAGFLLWPGLSLIIAVAELGVQIGLIDRQLQASIIILAIASATIAPAAFRFLAPPLPAPAPGAQPGGMSTA